MNIFTRLLFIVTFLNVFVLSVNAQQSNLDYKPWSFNINFGQTLFWGDGNNDITNPFSAYFKSDISQFGYGLIVQKNFNSWLGVDLQYLGGSLKGTRYTWSDKTPANLYFQSKINSVGLNLDIDVLDLFMSKQPTRMFNFYIRGGGAYNFYNATEYNLANNAVIATAKGGAPEVVGGWGIRIDLNKNIGMTFENIFTYSFDDFLDAHSTQYSEANDIFAYTSIGATYRIYPKPRKPRLEKEEIIKPIDTTIAVVEETPEEKQMLALKTIMPGQMNMSDTVLVRFQISKYDLNENAKLQHTLPMGFEGLENQSADALFQFSDQIVSFTWSQLPKDEETIEVSYYLVSQKQQEGNYNLPGILFYSEKGKENIEQFKQTIKVVQPVVAKVDPVIKPAGPDTQNPNQQTTKIVTPENNTNIETKPVNTTPSKPIEGLEYRVQVKAIYGGKSTPQSIARQYNISEDVSEDFVNGYSKYTAGHFATYEEAQAYRNQLRSSTVPGAFVVAYYNGQRVSNITEALKMEGQKPVVNTTQSKPAVVTQGVSYSIQIAASSRELSATSLKNQFGLSEQVFMTTHNGLYKYLVGSYTTKESASQALSNLKGKVSDAFIVKFVNGIRE